MELDIYSAFPGENPCSEEINILSPLLNTNPTTSTPASTNNHNHNNNNNNHHHTLNNNNCTDISMEEEEGEVEHHSSSSNDFPSSTFTISDCNDFVPSLDSVSVDKLSSKVGTPDYLAPEVILGQGH